MGIVSEVSYEAGYRQAFDDLSSLFESIAVLHVLHQDDPRLRSVFDDWKTVLRTFREEYPPGG